MKVIVYHAAYGCETGCTGHIVELREGDQLVDGRFCFEHPYGQDPVEFAKELVRKEFGDQHVADLVWAECSIVDE